MRVAKAIEIVMCLAAFGGCGTTKWSDTARTATEQLLITDSIDRAVSRLDMRALAGKKVFVDDSPAKGVTDSAYLGSAIRQHVLASGAILKTNRDEADYILEVRAGAVGTDRNDVLFGIPATNIPSFGVMAGAPSQIPEIAFAKKTDQRGVAKISMFAYNKQTGRPVWQSGAVPEESSTKALWVLGAGPFQRGTIHRGTTFAGAKLNIPLIDPVLGNQGSIAPVAVADEAYFVEPKEPVADGKNQEHGAGSEAGSATAGGAKPPEAGPASPAASTPPSPPPVPPSASGLAPAAEMRSAPPPAAMDVAPAGAFLPVGPAADSVPSHETFRGDAWLDRLR